MDKISQIHGRGSDALPEIQQTLHITALRYRAIHRFEVSRLLPPRYHFGVYYLTRKQIPLAP